MEQLMHFVNTASYEEWKDFLAHIEQRRNKGMRRLCELVESIIRDYEKLAGGANEK